MCTWKQGDRDQGPGSPGATVIGVCGLSVSCFWDRVQRKQSLLLTPELPPLCMLNTLFLLEKSAPVGYTLLMLFPPRDSESVLKIIFTGFEFKNDTCIP